MTMFVRFSRSSSSVPQSTQARATTIGHHYTSQRHAITPLPLLFSFIMAPTPTPAIGRGNTPLITAASEGFTDVIQQLVCQCDLMLTSSWGDTALHAAAEAGFENIASLLIARGGEALIGARNHRNQTARQIALNSDHTGIVRLIDGHLKSSVSRRIGPVALGAWI